LWENVLASDDYKEMMETHTCFGELDHPTDRIESSLEKMAVVLTNMEIRRYEGILWVEFDILDTPNGRILKSLFDYGCKIGVSSRGLGDEIQRDGQTIIDPDTYSYYGHDMVVQPAVKAARPDKVESLKKARAKVTDVFKKEIENATTQSELIGLKRLAESVNMPNLDSIKESIENKLSNGSLDGNNISESLENDLGRLAEENEDLKYQIENLKKANNISAKKSRKISETYESEVVTARRTLRRLEVKNERLERENNRLLRETDSINRELIEEKRQLRRREVSQERMVSDLQSKMESALSEIEELKRELRESKIQIRELEEENGMITEKYQELKESYRETEDQVVQLESEINTKANEIDSLYEENSMLTDNLERVSSKSSITESKIQDVSNKLTEKDTHLTEALDKYLDAKCKAEGIDKARAKSTLSGNYTIQEIDMVVEKLVDEKCRLNKMPISFKPLSAQLENYTGMSAEDLQTMKFLENSFHKN
jgi:predicted  nucleic acid-binding Zn-ribbon protein